MDKICINLVLSTLTMGNLISIGAIIGTAILALLAMLGKLLYNMGGLDKSVSNLDKKFDKIDEKLDKYIMTPLANSKSPVKLTDLGLQIFDRQKIQEFVKANYDEILTKMKSFKLSSAYEAQEKLFTLIDGYKNGKYKNELESEAFETGQHIDILMKVIAIGIRDRLFSEINFNIADIDKNNPESPKQ